MVGTALFMLFLAVAIGTLLAFAIAFVFTFGAFVPCVSLFVLVIHRPFLLARL